MTHEQQQALAELERKLRSLAKGATGLADILGGHVEGVDLVERDGYPEAPARVADLVAYDVKVRAANVEKALEVFRAAFAPVPLRLVEKD